MGFGVGSYLKFSTKNGNADAGLSSGGGAHKFRCFTSRKDKETGKTNYDWSGYVNFVGTAKQEIEKHKLDNDSIRNLSFKIGSCTVTSSYDKEKQREYVNYTVFEGEVHVWDQNGQTPAQASAPAPAPAPAPAAQPAQAEDPFSGGGESLPWEAELPFGDMPAEFQVQ